MSYCNNCGTGFQLVETQGFYSWECREENYDQTLSSRTLGFTNHAGVCPVFDVVTNEIIDTLSSTEEVLNQYPTAVWYDHL